ncbi:MAG: S-layer family protein [Cyanobacteria bacterium J06649_4]
MTGLALSSPVLSGPALAQILLEDRFTTTTVIQDDVQQSFVVEGGTLQGQSLFHSFETFSPETWAVTFNLEATDYNSVDFVIGRVTGQQPSLIDGTLSVLGGNAPDLVFINPAGITFGPNASLQLPGSFVASSAETVLFESYQFSAINPEPLPMLSISTPIGLHLGSSAGAIVQTGTGHSLTSEADPLFAPYQLSDPSQTHRGLRVQPRQTLALVGNELSFYGGLLTAPSGNIDLFSLNQGQVDFSFQDQTLSQEQTLDQTLRVLPNNSAANFQDITLSQRALIDVSGAAAGSIAAHGNNIRLTDGSVVWSQNRGISAAGELSINAQQSLTLGGQITQGAMLSSIMTSTIGPGTASNLVVNTPSLTVADGSSLGSRTFLGTGQGGKVTINATNLTVEGYVAIAPQIFSRMGTFTAGPGNAGELVVHAEQIAIKQGSFLGSTTVLAEGDGGDVYINAQDITVTGATPMGDLSLLVSSSIASNGDAGNLTVVRDRLTVRDSASVLTSSFSAGSAGVVNVTANEFIRVGGQSPGLRDSSISSSVVVAPPNYQERLGSFTSPTGDAGQVIIRTGILQIDEGGVVNVANQGSGQAGTLTAKTQNIVLNGGDISAITLSGQGGNINLGAQTLRASDGSKIQATSFGLGDGGNIDIDANFIVGRQNSDIVANAINGNGGNITINSQGLYGFEFRDQLTDQNDITASSEFGLEGSVEISNVALDAQAGLVSLPVYFSDTDNQVIASCATAHVNHFVASGRGGLATNPSDHIETLRPWQDIRAMAQLLEHRTAPRPTIQHSRRATAFVPLAHQSSEADINSTFQEATSWERDRNNEVKLLTSSFAQAPAANCLTTEMD